MEVDSSYSPDSGRGPDPAQQPGGEAGEAGPSTGGPHRQVSHCRTLSDRRADTVPAFIAFSCKHQASKIACVACRSLKMRCHRESDDTEIPCDRCKRALRHIQSEMEKVSGGKGSSDLQNVMSLLAASGEDIKIEPDALAALLAARTTQTEGQLDLYSSFDDGDPHASTSARPFDGPSPRRLPLPDLHHLAGPSHLAGPPHLHPHPHPHDPTSFPLHPPQISESLIPRGRSFSLQNILSPSSDLTESPTFPGDHALKSSLSNPLALLAAASEAVRGPSRSGDSSLPVARPSPVHARPVVEILAGAALDPRLGALNLSRESLEEALKKVTAPTTAEMDLVPMRSFRPRASSTKRDLNPEWDPLAIGLLTDQQATVFFREFFTQMHPFVSVLDPSIHTPSFCRARSFFLYTAICAAGAQFSAAGSPDASLRLRHHAERLAKIVIRDEYKSLEIAQGFLLWFPWLPPSDQLSEDRILFYVQQLFAMAKELGLDRPLAASDDQILTILQDDLAGLDSSDSETLERMIRNRERFWLRFFNWESSSAVSLGRSSLFIENTLLRSETWHVSPLACSEDWETMAITRLRRYITNLSADVKDRLRRNPHEGTDWIRSFVDESLDLWRTKWLTLERSDHDYLELLYRHGRLFILTHGLHTASANESPPVPPTIVNDCFIFALEAVHAAVQSFEKSRYYWKLPQTVFPMLAWAAVLSMKLFDTDIDGFAASQGSLLGLLANLALLLEQIGTTPSHRVGVAAVYGSHLKVVVRERVHSVWKLHEESGEADGSTKLLGVHPGTITPIYGDPGASLPLKDWGSEWWSEAAGESAGQLPWSEEVRRMLFELDGDGSLS